LGKKFIPDPDSGGKKAPDPAGSATLHCLKAVADKFNLFIRITEEKYCWS
jgi:hypothetical protein